MIAAGRASASSGKRRVAALIASRNRPDLVRDAVANLRDTCSPDGCELDIIVVECGTDRDKLCEHSTLVYEDAEFRGKCFGHHLALDLAARRGGYDYYWPLHNDVRFDGTLDPAAELIATLESEPAMAICSPWNIDGHFPQGWQADGRRFHPVCVCDYLGFMVKADAVERVGFLNPAFRYCWGAIHELAFKLYSAGWFIAYSDRLTMKHLGGSTYGAAGTHTISREDYQANAARFAYDYFRQRYGENWHDTFWAAAQGHGIGFNTFTYHRRFWARWFSEQELAERDGTACGAARRCGTRVPVTATAATQPPTPQLAEQVNALHPWFVPADVGGLQVVPGVGTEWRADWLSNRIAARRTMMVDAVCERIDMTGKRVLDLACNCGYWSARYAERGAAWVLGVEGRARHLAQAELYWRTNRFIGEGRYQFIRGDVADADTWPAIEQRGPFDVTLCAGILYHVLDYAAVLRRAAAVTREAMIIDTRVTDGAERPVREPGDLNFNAIPEALDKVVPNRDRLIAVMDELGFDVEPLPATFGAPWGLRNVDDYAAGRRVCLLAMRRVPAALGDDGAADHAIRLHLGCGPDKRDGWINIDVNPDNEPDLVGSADDLCDFADASVDAIEACHLFEHFTLDQAQAALREWARALRPGGTLALELPDLDGCVRLIGRAADPRGYDMGMIGLFGYPPLIAAEGDAQVHKWAWTAATLTDALRIAGFDDVRPEPVTQHWRHAARLGRDMRLVARRADVARPVARERSVAGVE